MNVLFLDLKIPDKSGPDFRICRVFNVRLIVDELATVLKAGLFFYGMSHQD
jgi:hypothetical protein